MSDAPTIHATDDNRFWINADQVTWFTNLVKESGERDKEIRQLRSRVFELEQQLARKSMPGAVSS